MLIEPFATLVEEKLVRLLSSIFGTLNSAGVLGALVIGHLLYCWLRSSSVVDCGQGLKVIVYVSASVL